MQPKITRQQLFELTDIESYQIKIHFKDNTATGINVMN